MAGVKGKGRTVGATESEYTKDLKRICKTVVLKQKNLSNADIAKLTNQNDKRVERTLKKFGDIFTSLENIRDYRECKSELFDVVEMEMIKSLMSRDKIEKASLNNVAYAFTQLHSAGRLERGQATQITASFSRVITDNSDVSNTITITPDAPDMSDNNNY